MSVTAPASPAPHSAAKTCPDCAETVLVEANVCRYCSFRFQEAASGTPDPVPAAERKSPGGAFLLGLVIPGLGSFYVGETQRGRIYLSALALSIICGVLAIVIYPTVQGLGLLGGLVLAGMSALDAHAAAKLFNAGGRARKPSGGVWLILAVIAVLGSVEIGLNIGDADANDQQYDECVTEGTLSEAQCSRIYY